MSEEKKDNTKKDDGQARKDTFIETIKRIVQNGEEKRKQQSTDKKE